MQRIMAGFGLRYATIVLLTVLHIKCRYAEALAQPQNPMEAFGLGAMTVLNTASEVLNNGGAVRRDTDLETPFFKIRGKTEAGMGDAMRPRAKDSDEDDDRRRKRDLSDIEILGELNMLPDGSPTRWHIHRGKRSPCFTHGYGMPQYPSMPSGGTGTGGGGGGDAVDPGDVDYGDEFRRRRRERRRRALQRVKRMRARRRQRKANNARRRRRRRQAEFDGEGNAPEDLGSRISEHAKQVARKIKGMFDAMVQGFHTMIENVKNTFKPSPSETDFETNL